VGPRFSQPLLLGVLAQDGRVHHDLVDPRLHGAARGGAGGCMATTLDEAVSRVLADGADEASSVISWSNFDREIVRAHAALPDEALAAFERRHVNALAAARRWATTWRVALDPDTADQGHTLGRYMRATGYKLPAHIAAVAPARLLRRVLAQLAARGGRYRDLTQQAKRDWHLVLAYNRHDLLGLRHVHRRVAADLALLDWYRAAIVSLEGGRRGVRWAVGAGVPAKLGAALDAAGDDRYAVLVADAEVAGEAPAAAAWLDGLRARLAADGLRWVAATVSSAATPLEPGRPAAIVMGLGTRPARRLARASGLRLLLWGSRHGASRVLLAERGGEKAT
jgi:hypothetical protein